MRSPPLGDEFRSGDAGHDLLLKERSPEVFLESTRRVALGAQPALVRLLREAVCGPEYFLGLNGTRELSVTHPHAGGGGGADEHLGIDHRVEHIAPQPSVHLVADEPGTEHRLKLLAATRVCPLIVVVADFHVVDGRDRHAAFGSHVLMHSPERERNADEDDDSPCNPSRRVVSYELEHELDLGASCAAEPVRRGRWRMAVRRHARKAKRARERARRRREVLAEWTGLEPATPGVTGRYSNQLNYHSEIVLPPDRNLARLPSDRRGMCRSRPSPRETTACHSTRSLEPLVYETPLQFRLNCKDRRGSRRLVGAEGFEPPTFAL